MPITGSGARQAPAHLPLRQASVSSQPPVTSRPSAQRQPRGIPLLQYLSRGAEVSPSGKGDKRRSMPSRIQAKARKHTPATSLKTRRSSPAPRSARSPGPASKVRKGWRRSVTRADARYQQQHRDRGARPGRGGGDRQPLPEHGVRLGRGARDGPDGMSGFLLPGARSAPSPEVSPSRAARDLATLAAWHRWQSCPAGRAGAATLSREWLLRRERWTRRWRGRRRRRRRIGAAGRAVPGTGAASAGSLDGPSASASSTARWSPVMPVAPAQAVTPERTACPRSAREMVDWLTPVAWARSRPDSPASRRVRRGPAASWLRRARGAPDGALVTVFRPSAGPGRRRGAPSTAGQGCGR
jgi:hypothetical protein